MLILTNCFKVMETLGDYEDKVSLLIEKRNFEREELAKSIANIFAKAKAVEQKLTIYTDSDDDWFSYRSIWISNKVSNTSQLIAGFFISYRGDIPAR